jgi:hypothetical protein
MEGVRGGCKSCRPKGNPSTHQSGTDGCACTHHQHTQHASKKRRQTGIAGQHESCGAPAPTLKQKPRAPQRDSPTIESEKGSRRMGPSAHILFLSRGMWRYTRCILLRTDMRDIGACSSNQPNVTPRGGRNTATPSTLDTSMHSAVRHAGKQHKGLCHTVVQVAP